MTSIYQDFADSVVRKAEELLTAEPIATADLARLISGKGVTPKAELTAICAALLAAAHDGHPAAHRARQVKSIYGRQYHPFLWYSAL